jgi:hypothetical protein
VNHPRVFKEENMMDEFDEVDHCRPELTLDGMAAEDESVGAPSQAVSGAPKQYLFLGGFHHGCKMCVVSPPEGYTLRSYNGTEVYTADEPDAERLQWVGAMLDVILR